MGAVNIDLEKGMKQLESEYDLYEKKGVLKLLKDYYYLKERMYVRGDFDAVVVLADLEKAIALANLGTRQSQVIELWKLRYNREEIAEEFDLASNTVRESLNSAATKIASVYKKWGYVNAIQ